eukprot:GFYU01000242.1.p2 GENE.GFYU01000242.1~~GFYU01000242.1.p2  ORF type:complete len:340 (+),score=136.39 GFYU01000242.1:11-1030(+)
MNNQRRVHGDNQSNRYYLNMSKLLVFLTGVTAALANEHPSFDEFTKTFYKQYESEDMYHYRRSVYDMNVKKVEWLNSQREGPSDAHYAVNIFADLTESEFAEKYLGVNPMAETIDTFPEAAELDASAAPASFDWRSKGAVTPVKNQQQCGSCWAFSTTGDIEGKNQIATGKLVSLSEQMLVDCDHNGDQGCQGGLPSQAMQWIIKNGGIETEADYPYKAVNGQCHSEASKTAVKISGWEKVSTDESQIAAYLAEHGPLSIGINAGPMQFYAGGVANPFLCNPKKLDHGVLIVGYGTDAGKDYWIIKNSWGKAWGEQGYYRIIRGKGKCGLNTMVVSSKV